MNECQEYNGISHICPVEPISDKRADNCFLGTWGNPHTGDNIGVGSWGMGLKDV
jgi:hypothetical protein